MTEFKRVFVDTAPIIYYLENSFLYINSVKKFFTKCIEEDIKIVTSTITVEEYLVFPYGSGKMEFAENFKAMDALQIATAIVSGCDMFFTNDKQLRQEKEIPCMTMEDIE